MRLASVILSLLVLASTASAYSKGEKATRRAVERAIKRMEQEPGAAQHVPLLRRAVHRALRSGTLTMVDGSVRARTAVIEQPGGGAAAMIEASSSKYPNGAAHVDVIIPEQGGGSRTLRVSLHPRDGFKTDETFSLTTRIPWRDL